MRLALIIAAAVLLAVGCGGGAERAPRTVAPEPAQAQAQREAGQQSSTDQPQATDAPTAPDQPAAVEQGQPQELVEADEPEPQQSAPERAEPVEQHRFIEALDGRTFEQPIELLAWPERGLLVAEQRGSLTVYGEDGSIRGLLDLSDRVRFAGERGLLSVAVDPQFAERPFLYIWYSPRSADLTRLSRFSVANGVADRESELVILEVQQPYPNHNGGAVRFGPDGMLYLGIGDGGAANDPHEHGQNRATLLGTIIRIDVSTASAQYRYASRPTIRSSACPVCGPRSSPTACAIRGAWPSIPTPATSGSPMWARTASRRWASSKRARIRVGTSSRATSASADQSDCDALEHSPPLATYGHDLGCSVTGGVVYRGSELPWLTGAYLFADFCTGRVWALQRGESGWEIVQLEQLDAQIASFGVDHDGEVYLLTFDGPILRLSRAE